MKTFIIYVTLFFQLLNASAQVFTWTGARPIYDMRSDTIPLSVSGIRNIMDTAFGFAHVCLDIQHTYKSDLVITLLSPAGTNITLIQSIGGSGNNFTGTCLGADGTHFSNATAPYTGIFKPVGYVTQFNNGQNPNGTWRLIVKDIANSDTGFVNRFSLEFMQNPPRDTLPRYITTPTGTFRCATCVCPGGTAGCDLLPDMTASAKEIQLNHSESPGALEISNATPNIGYGPIEIYGMDSCFCGTTPVPCGTVCPNGEEIKHLIKQRIYVKIPGTDTLGFYDRRAGEMTYHPTHNHLHVDNWSSYTIRSATSNPDATTWPILGRGVKQSFCLINLGKCPNNPGECVDKNGITLTSFPNYNFGFQSGCGLQQGIYPGNYDVYSMSLNDPIDLTNVCNGNYYIVSITDPNNNFLESDETNNWVAVPITLAQQNLTPLVTYTGSLALCTGDSVILTAGNASRVIWSTGDTTRSIVVRTPGNYTATNRCGAAVSAPVTVTQTSATSSASLSIAVASGNNPGCADDPIVFAASPVNGGLSPVYQWKVNGVNAGTNSNIFSLPGHVNGQSVTCQLNSSLNCLLNSTATSNAILVQETSNQPPSVSITQTRGSNPSCYGDTVKYSATVSNGTNISYQWKRNGNNVGANNSDYQCSDAQAGDSIRCIITASPLCDAKARIGTGTSMNSTTSNVGAAYPTYYGNGRQQHLIRASELTSLGFTAGYFNTISFQVGAATGDPDTLKNFTIRLAQVYDTSLSGTFLAPALTAVAGPIAYKPILNSLNTHYFSAPYYWNGTANLLIDICFANGVYGTKAYQSSYSTTTFYSSSYFQQDYAAGSGACAQATGSGAHRNRPNMILGKNAPVTMSSNTIIMNTADTLYKFTGNGLWSVSSNWLNNKIPPTTLPSCSKIVVDPITGGESTLNYQQIISTGARFIVMPGKKFYVLGKLYMY